MDLSSAAGVTTVPEHSVAFMKAVSGGESLVRNNFLFLAGPGWLVAIGYPLRGAYDPLTFSGALDEVMAETGATDCWAAAPELPPAIAPFRIESDVYFVLPASAAVPPRLKNPVRKAASVLTIDETKDFTAAHRRLWAEFLRRKNLKPMVRELYARIPAILAAPGTDIRLLNAWAGDGGLAACLVMDYAPEEFSAYIAGAHSRAASVPHAVDALFAAMLENARAEGKKYVHLGLGVNEGITRFKKKWGGVAALPYHAASWTAGRGKSKPHAAGDAVLESFLAMGSGHAPANDPYGDCRVLDERPFAMLWKLTKNGRTSWIGGTAHSFRYSFAAAFRKLFREVDTVLFEGPLDPASLAAFGRHGSTRDADAPRVIDHLSEDQILRLERVVNGPRGRLAASLNMTWRSPADVRGILARHRPWSVFFTLYNAFLERHGWTRSVDLEAWKIAHETARNVIGMESVEEQLAALESVPMDRIVRFLGDPEDWRRRMRESKAAYLSGDLTRMLNTSAEFPTRTNTVIGLRDQRFRERMRPHIERGRAAVFVGTAHMLNLETMLREDGFTVTRVPHTLTGKIMARLRRR